ncbi:MAG: DUF4178 domain-containing protein [Thermomicrobiales bacterium]|nr:DUF4178 domain-containing protein [Thermomicrobiales bacterium]
MLDRVPGYAGYREKERRRDSDRAIRDKIEADFGQQAERLGRLANRLADERQLEAIGVINRPLTDLRSFLDRVRTATYGYSPLFANDEVDETVLDQIAAFDSALADYVPDVERDVAALEAASPSDSSFKSAAEQLSTTIQQVSARFDTRSEIIHAGKPIPEKDMLAVLQPDKPAAPQAMQLQTGDAVSHNGTDYVVIGHVTAEFANSKSRAFQLRGGDDKQWLAVVGGERAAMYWLEEGMLNQGTLGKSVTIDEQTFQLQRDEQGSSEVEGRQGEADRHVRFLMYASENKVLHIYDWGAQRLVLVGIAIDQRDVEIFQR